MFSTLLLKRFGNKLVIRANEMALSQSSEMSNSAKSTKKQMLEKVRSELRLEYKDRIKVKTCPQLNLLLVYLVRGIKDMNQCNIVYYIASGVKCMIPDASLVLILSMNLYGDISVIAFSIIYNYKSTKSYQNMWKLFQEFGAPSPTTIIAATNDTFQDGINVGFEGKCIVVKSSYYLLKEAKKKLKGFI